MENWQKKIQENFGNLESIFIINTNLDDIRGEILGDLIPKLMDSGALDATLISTITKKNRPGYILTVLCSEEQIIHLIEIIQATTGTLGIRVRKEMRVCLKRVIVSKNIIINNSSYAYRVKHAFDHKNNKINSKIEFEDIKNIADKEKRSILEIEKILLNNQ